MDFRTTVGKTGSHRGDTLLMLFKTYDSTGMLDDVVKLVKQMEQVKDDHPRYNGCFQTFTTDFLTVIRNAQADEDDVIEAAGAWLTASISEIETVLNKN